MAATGLKKMGQQKAGKTLNISLATVQGIIKIWRSLCVQGARLKTNTE